MAAPSATPGNAPAGKTKKELTPEQKKTFTGLGVIGVLAVIAVAANWSAITGGGSSTPPAPSPDTTVPAPPSGDATSAPPTDTTGIAPESAGAPSGDTTAAPATGAAVVYAGVNKARPDPFSPFVVIPEIPEPEPTPIPPVEIPSPSSLEPLVISAPDASSERARQPLILPGVVIPRMNVEVKSPRDAFPPARQSGAGGSTADPEPSYDKRLSGVVIANGVRALLEINGLERKSYVVQPGDTVEGITILDIQRFEEGGRTITRMLIRENGQQRYVDLKAAPAPLTGPEGAGPGGFPGGAP